MNNFDKSVFSYIINWFIFIFRFNLKLKGGKVILKVFVIWYVWVEVKVFFFKIGLISIIRKIKGIKLLVSSVLIILLVISVIIEI